MTTVSPAKDEVELLIERLRKDDDLSARLEAADLLAAMSPVDRLREALTSISSQAICYGMKADEAELRDWLRFISETADAALSSPVPAGRHP